MFKRVDCFSCSVPWVRQMRMDIGGISLSILDVRLGAKGADLGIFDVII